GRRSRSRRPPRIGARKWGCRCPLSDSTGSGVKMPSTMEAHILVVDDHAALRELVREYLSEHDYQVSVAETGGEMDKILAVDHVDLVILDLKLPDEAGQAIAGRVRETADLQS